MYRIDRSKLPQSKQVTVSGCIYKGPALITALSLTGTAATPDAQVYDGENSNGEQKIDLRAIQDMGYSPYLGGGIFCERGIYVAVDAATSPVTVVFYPAVNCEVEQ